MSTHADVIRAKRDAFLDVAVGEADEHGGCGCLLCGALADLRAAEQAACGECDATGGKLITTIFGDGKLADFVPCPACHGTGRKPDTFRDDGATTPEGCEDERQGEVPGA